jgi:4-hydroxythreonine-4-phosphate dehydrogenase
MVPRPLLALALGDPAGIGPEICLKAAAEPRLREHMRLVLLGPSELRPAAIARLEAPEALAQDVGWIDTATCGSWRMGAAQASAAGAALAALRAGHELALAGQVDALVTAPVSKEALHMAGERVEGQTELLARWCGRPAYMLAVARGLRVLLCTRHVPLATALARLSAELVLEHLRALDRGLRELGFPSPRLALAGLNPHAGENGVLGSEELERLVPAVNAARREGLDVCGPESPDTVFLRAWRGAFDGVLALYHDQAFIPIKIVAPDEGLTVLLGLPYLRVSPAHGTAFDIAGRGQARHENLVVALVQAAAWAARRVERRG